MDAHFVTVPDGSLSPSSTADALTLRATACAILLGFGVCLANMYFGLQAGMVNAMPMQSALLGFALFRSIQHRLRTPLSPMETTVMEIVSGALGLAPFTTGFTSFIPALEFLTTPDEHGPATRFSTGQLLLWSTAMCGLGIVSGAPFRNLFIKRERLRYPSATATATLIGVLFRREDIVARAGPSETDNNTTVSVATASVPLVSHPDLDSNQPAIAALLWSLAGSFVFCVPIFGTPAARDWFWAFDLSPAYIGYGIIIGPTINVYMLLGAVIGWGILSPVAKNNGWAPGPVGDWETGSRGWILWTGMGLILGDTFIGLSWTGVWPLLSLLLSHTRQTLSRRLTEEEAPLILNDPDLHVHVLSSSGIGTRTADPADDDWADSSLVTNVLLLWAASGIVILFLVSVLVAFQDLVPVLATLVAAAFLPLAGVISMRSLGETDNGAGLAIGRLAQFMIALLVRPSSQHYTTANLLLGGAIESGASQASQHMGGLKTAYMTQTPPRAVFYGQMIGSYAGALAATGLYRMYTSTNTIPSEEFGVPDAHLYMVASRFIRQQGLPPGAMGFTVGAFVLGAVMSMLRILGSKYWWRRFVPSGVAVAIGMHIMPAITLPRVAMIRRIVAREARVKHGDLHNGFRMDRYTLRLDTNFVPGRQAPGDLGSEIGPVQLEDGSTVDGGHVLMRGQWNVAFDRRLVAAARPEDIWVSKNRHSGFWGGTGIEAALKSRGIRTLFFSGANMDQCVATSAIDAYAHGWDCLLLSDACATTSPDFARQCVEFECAVGWGFVLTCQQLADGIDNIQTAVPDF
ncbi:oligopeptide transporter [Grosmannia clavigera kw1407]|uniref:Oligopeptide transporter n=1 Tax=Grosmannia clavigera (strain kw1407 / UAMH 11150) TaxID=655863 RepID=F0XPP3_GROCL|nr:oligopeptide transporter [Grosmannia clavigera kw1407]EFX00469.1 oligopeptide transporter [Grosmannia clavigera kw1407]